MYIDSHAHLTMEHFDADREEVIERARGAGIEAIIVVGTDVASSLAAIELAARHPQLSPTAGIHPHDAEGVEEASWARLEELARRPEVVAVGETGLDYFKAYAPLEAQRQALRRQLCLAREVRKPVVIHCRDAGDDLLAILREEHAEECGGVMHCFSGAQALAEACLELGFYISFAGQLTFANAESLRGVAKALPVDRLMVETDCPYLAPAPRRGKRNEPSFVPHTAARLAELQGLTIADIARITTSNARRLFRLDGGRGPEERQGAIAYRIRRSLYLNITNRCTSDCSFCARGLDPIVKGHFLGLEEEPTAEALCSAVAEHLAADREGIEEIVFCGYGEPTLRLTVLLDVARYCKALGLPVRLNTNGHGNLIHKRDIVPELVGLIDAVSVSLNAETPQGYVAVCRPRFGPRAYDAMLEFIRRCRDALPRVIATAVRGIPGAPVDIEACRRLAEVELGVEFRVREYDRVG